MPAKVHVGCEASVGGMRVNAHVHVCAWGLRGCIRDHVECVGH